MQRNRTLEVKKRNLGHTVSLLSISFQGKTKLFSWKWILDCKALSTETKSKTKGGIPRKPDLSSCNYFTKGT